MLVLLSPAKSLDFDKPAGHWPKTSPKLKKDIDELSNVARKLSASDLRSLMGISQDLADLNRNRFQMLSKSGDNDTRKQALLAFNGDVYRGFGAADLDPDLANRTQKTIRILSGLYGVLRPFDTIDPYRLEMGTRLKTKRGETLYDFWDRKVTDALNFDLTGKNDIVVNLASKEYFSVVQPKRLEAKLVTPEFKEEKSGKTRVLGFYAKYARGRMARWIVENDPQTAEDLQAFAQDGYTFRPDLSKPATPVFARPQPDPKS